MAAAFDRCVIVDCPSIVADGDLVYCPEHRRKADDGTLWPEARCVFCGEPLATGDKIACTEHRRQLDATMMPWDQPATGDVPCGPAQAANESSPTTNNDRPTPTTTAVAGTALISDAPRCHGCGEVLGRERLTLPRAVSGDLVFHSFACQQMWRAASTPNREASLVP